MTKAPPPHIVCRVGGGDPRAGSGRGAALPVDARAAGAAWVSRPDSVCVAGEGVRGNGPKLSRGIRQGAGANPVPQGFNTEDDGEPRRVAAGRNMVRSGGTARMALRAERHHLPGTHSASPVARGSPWLSVARLLSSVLNPDLAEAPPALMVESGRRRAEHDRTLCNVGTDGASRAGDRHGAKRLVMTGVSGTGRGPTICAFISVIGGSTCLRSIPTAPTPGDRTPYNVGRAQTWEGAQPESCTTKARRHEGRRPITSSSWIAHSVMALRAKRRNACAPTSLSARVQRSPCLRAFVVNLSCPAETPLAPTVTPDRRRADHDRTLCNVGTDRTSRAGGHHGAKRLAMTGVSGLRPGPNDLCLSPCPLGHLWFDLLAACPHSNNSGRQDLIQRGNG
jgi:hypothetical protein